MESFEIDVKHLDTLHHLRVEHEGEDPEFRVYRESELVGTLRCECDERGDYWVSNDLIDADFLEKIGDRIEKYHR